jgi:hypothetical protein
VPIFLDTYPWHGLHRSLRNNCLCLPARSDSHDIAGEDRNSNNNETSWVCHHHVCTQLLRWVCHHHVCTQLLRNDRSLVVQYDWNTLLGVVVVIMYGNWNNNYLFRQCLSPLMLYIRIPIKARCTRCNIMW